MPRVCCANVRLQASGMGFFYIRVDATALTTVICRDGSQPNLAWPSTATSKIFQQHRRKHLQPTESFGRSKWVAKFLFCSL
jgi:hypothetical protein